MISIKQEKKMMGWIKLIGIVFIFVGYGILISENWRVALGVFLVHFAINIEHGTPAHKKSLLDL